jgi:DNA-binding NarL/FixJ family response regulator
MIMRWCAEAYERCSNPRRASSSSEKSPTAARSRGTAAGRPFLSTPLSQSRLRAYTDRGVQAATDPYETLSVREREVFDLAAHGVTNSEIGRRLAISRRTAESHRSNLMRKLALKGEKDLLRYAVRRGILSLDSGV